MEAITDDLDKGEKFLLETFPEPTVTDKIGGMFVELGLLYSEVFYWASEAFTRAVFTPIRPGEYGNLDNRILEVARRVFVVALNTVASPLTGLAFVAGGLLQLAGDFISENPYWHIKGSAPESWNKDRHTLFTLNVCMYWGLLPMLFGGVYPARDRLDQLEKLLRIQNPDIVVLQEMSSSSGRRLAARLDDQYAHFFTHIGGSRTWVNSGTFGAELFVASKAPIVSVRFVPYEDENAARKIGFFCIETPSSWVITAHFPDQTVETWQTHRLLLNQIATTIEDLKQETKKPCFLLGDLNIRRTGKPNDEYAQSGIPEYFYDPYTEKHPEFNEETCTCTNLLVPNMLGDPEPLENKREIDDYVLIDKKSKDLYRIDVRLGTETFDMNHPDQALTDHRYYLATVTSV